MSRLEDNIVLALAVPVVVTGIASVLFKARVRFLSFWSALVSVVLWMAVLTVNSGEVSNVWPIACMVWLFLFWPAAGVVRLVFWIWKSCVGTTHATACRQCGYCLTGNISGVCPECGATVGSATIREENLQ